MTPQQALLVVTQVIEQVRMTASEHRQVQSAITTLDMFVNEQKPNEKNITPSK